MKDEGSREGERRDGPRGMRILERNWRGVQSHVVRLNVAEGPLQNSRRRRLVAWPPAERHPTRR